MSQKKCIGCGIDLPFGYDGNYCLRCFLHNEDIIVKPLYDNDYPVRTIDEDYHGPSDYEYPDLLMDDVEEM